MTAVVRSGQIQGMARFGLIAETHNVRMINAAGKYMIPGLWDMDVHTADISAAWDEKIIYPLYVANDVTGVRDMGGARDLLQRMKLSPFPTEAGHSHCPFHLAICSLQLSPGPLCSKHRPLCSGSCRHRFPSAPTMTGVRLDSTHADFSLRKRNSITFPRSSGKPRSIFFWKLFGM